jgi:hypothetical protein
MHRSPIPRGIVLTLLVIAVLLPIAVCVILALSALLAAMGDAAGGRAMVYAAWGLGALWVTDLAGLVVLLAVRTLLGPDDPRE